MDAVRDAAREDCPKHMVFGPCGGVRPDGCCEMAERPCAFPSVVGPPTPLVQPARVDVPLVLSDLSVPPFDRPALEAAAGLLAPVSDAVLVGEHQDRPDFPPTLAAELLGDAGAHAWVTLACRDRNRVVLEQELRGLQAVGVGAVLCVTGDGRAYDVRPEVTQVFDLDGPRLTRLAAELGVAAAVPETPTAPPLDGRAQRLVTKQHCGAAVAVLNHVPQPAGVARFVADARRAGLGIPVLAAVAVYTDAGSANALQGLPGLELDRPTVAAVLGAADPVEAGIAAAVEEAGALLRIDGVQGVNLSGSASERGWRFGAEVKAEVARRIRAEQRSGRR